MSQKSKQLGLTTPPGGTWVQTDRAAHERWAQLAIANPRASSVLHVLVAQMGRHNAIVASQTTLAKAAHCSLPTLKRALSILREQGWIRSEEHTSELQSLMRNSYAVFCLTKTTTAYHKTHRYNHS